MNTFNEEEFIDICKQFDAEPVSRNITIEYETDHYFNKVKEAVATDRRGEVVFCVVRPNEKVITVTCAEYPEGIFRIPTGGIGHNENIVNAVFRETREELGLETDIKSFEGVIKFRFQHKDDFVMFYSYIFIMEEKGGRLLVDASDDEVSEVREEDIDDLIKTSRLLADIKGKWSDWGKFRYETTRAIIECFLMKNSK